jgi:hypothetical protein
MTNRVQFNKNGTLNEVVTDGGAHLEQMSDKHWFLAMQRADGSEYCVWFKGKITFQEEREPPMRWPNAKAPGCDTVG